ncbi:hypothetical protein L209DRAFT_174455 [Thermothelomyces heterothallicus CBS 203.75]
MPPGMHAAAGLTALSNDAGLLLRKEALAASARKCSVGDPRPHSQRLLNRHVFPQRITTECTEYGIPIHGTIMLRHGKEPLVCGGCCTQFSRGVHARHLLPVLSVVRHQVKASLALASDSVVLRKVTAQGQTRVCRTRGACDSYAPMYERDNLIQQNHVHTTQPDVAIAWCFEVRT